MVNPFTATGGSISRGGGGDPRGPSRKGSSDNDSGKGSSSFQEALKRGSAHAWKGRWEDAVGEYRRALEFAPKDLSARTYLAMALFKAEHLQEALQLYQELWKEQPSNLSMLLRLAEVQETMGDLEAAAANYQRLAELHTLRRAPNEALKAWQKAVALKPDDLALWDSTMEAALQAGLVSSLMPSYLGLARQLALEGRFEEAIGVVARGQTLDPSNSLVLPLLASIRGALAHSWRAIARGETTTPEDLARLIPTISALGSATPETMETRPSASPPPSDVEAFSEEESDSPTPAEVPELPEGPPDEPSLEELAPMVEEAALPEAESAGEGIALETPEPPEEPLPVVEEAPAEGDSSELQEPLAEETLAQRATMLPEEEPLPYAFTEAEPSGSVSAEEQPVAVPTVQGEEIEVVELKLEEAAASVPMDEGSLVEDSLPRTEPGELLGPEPEEDLEAPIEVSDEAEADVSSQVEQMDGSVARPMVDPSLLEEPSPEEFQESLESAGAEEGSSADAIAEQLAELAEAHEQAEEIEQAAETYGQALELSPRLPRALLGMARIHLAAGELDLAEERVRLILEGSDPEAARAQGLAAKLLLDILIGRAVSGDLKAVTEGLLWLRSVLPAERLQSSDVESSTEAIAQLLGRCGAEHLEELASLQPELRGEVVLALRRIEELLEGGKLRSAEDESYGLIADCPDFLPSQSLLARVLVAQGRTEEALERSQRLLELYEIRGTPEQALEILQWRFSSGIGDGEDRVRLVQLLRAQNRLIEADWVETGRDGALSIGHSATDTPPWEELLRRAEASFASGDRESAVGLLRAALEAEGTDEVARAALARVLQLMGDEGGRGELLETLSRLGLPAGLAD